YPTGSAQTLREAVTNGPFLPLERTVPSVYPAFARIVARCVERDPAERYPSAGALREELESLLGGGSAREVSPDSRPYPGLHAFGSEDRASFFGRDPEVRAVVERLRSEPLVLVAGDSGAGKSSLCRAGVLPRVAEGALGVGRAWAVRELLPGWRPL